MGQSEGHRSDQDVEDKEQGLPSTPASRTAFQRIVVRRQRLKALYIDNLDERVCTGLEDLWRAGKRMPASLRLRPAFLRRDEPLPEPISDRRLPPMPDRPPAARLISPRGIALRLYLVAMFEAQCTRGPGKVARDTRPIDDDGTARTPWSDLIAATADYTPGADTAATRTDNRVRQIKSALDRLADDDVGLVELPRAGVRVGRYRDFRLLNEAGTHPRRATPVRYRVPEREVVVKVPVSFFVNGWVHALTNREIAGYLMFRDLARLDPATHSREGVSIGGVERLQYYGLSKDTYESYQTLERFGLLDVESHPDRRADGTFENFDPDSLPPRHRFQLKDAGLDQPAVATVLKALS